MFTPARIVEQRNPGRRASDESLSWPGYGNRVNEPVKDDLVKRSCHSPLKTTGSLFEDPLNGPRIVVAETKVMIQGGEAMCLA
jgi:hypothetical protein